MAGLKHGDSVWGANGFGEWALVVFPALFDTQQSNGFAGVAVRGGLHLEPHPCSHLGACEPTKRGPELAS